MSFAMLRQGRPIPVPPPETAVRFLAAHPDAVTGGAGGPAFLGRRAAQARGAKTLVARADPTFAAVRTRIRGCAGLDPVKSVRQGDLAKGEYVFGDVMQLAMTFLAGHPEQLEGLVVGDLVAVHEYPDGGADPPVTG